MKFFKKMQYAICIFIKTSTNIDRRTDEFNLFFALKKFFISFMRKPYRAEKRKKIKR